MLPAPAGAATLYVTPFGQSGTHSTIQGAVDASAEGDSILVAGGLYRENVVLPSGRVLIGSWNGDFTAWDVDLWRTTIDAGFAGPCLLADWGEPDPHALLVGLHFVNGTGYYPPNTPEPEDPYGGGAYVIGLREIRDCVFEGNEAAYGAGLCLVSDELRMERVRFIGNRLEFWWFAGDDPPARSRYPTPPWEENRGGGALVDLTGDLRVIDCAFESNGTWIPDVHGMGIAVIARRVEVSGSRFIDNINSSSSDGNFGSGGGIMAHCDSLLISDCLFEGNRMEGGDKDAGAIYADGYLSVESSRFIENWAGAGGGIYSIGPEVRVESSRFVGNDANGGDGVGLGGAIYAQALIASDCNFRGNRGGGSFGGGGGAVSADDVRLTRCVFRGNRSTVWFHGRGGAVQVGDHLEVEGSVFRHNGFPTVSGRGGAIYLSEGGIGTVTNTVFFENHPVQDETEGAAMWGPIASRYNLFHGNGHVTNFGLADSVGHVHGDPLFKDHDEDDYRLLLHSAAIDAGDPAILDPDGSRSDIGLFGGPDALFDRPPRVTGLVVTAKPQGAGLVWDPVHAPDLAGYVVYGSDQPDFRPGEASHLATVSAAHWLDPEAAGGPRYYRVSAFDLDGLGGGYSDEEQRRLAALDSPPDRDPARLSIGLPSPNPSRGPVSFAIVSPGPVPGRLEVYDVTGRLVASRSFDLPAGASRVHWDGRDDAGRPTAAGVYLARLSVGEQRTVSRILRVR
jgi:hypothetical protein